MCSNSVFLGICGYLPHWHQNDSEVGKRKENSIFAAKISLDTLLTFLKITSGLWVSWFLRIQRYSLLRSASERYRKFISLEIHFSARDDAFSGSLFGKIVLGRLTFASYGLFAPRFFMFDFVPSSFFFSFQHSQLPQLFVPKGKKKPRKFTQAEKTWKKDSSIKE